MINYLNKLLQKYGYFICRSPKVILTSNTVEYEVAINSSVLYKPFFHTYDLSENSLEKRRHLFENSIKRTNHDPIILDLFVKLLFSVNKEITNICELGVWRGGWIENLAITGKKINYTGFDTFDLFPQLLNETSTTENQFIESKPFTISELKARLNPYKNLNAEFIAGDFLSYNSIIDNFDIYHFDMDYASCLKHFFKLVNLRDDDILIIDDYYHPRFFNLTHEINTAGQLIGRVPVNLCDYFGVPRTARSNFIAIMVKKYNL